MRSSLPELKLGGEIARKSGELLHVYVSRLMGIFADIYGDTTEREARIIICAMFLCAIRRTEKLTINSLVRTLKYVIEPDERLIARVTKRMFKNGLWADSKVRICEADDDNALSVELTCHVLCAAGMMETAEPSGFRLP